MKNFPAENITVIVIGINNDKMKNMNYDFSNFESRLKEVGEWLDKELTTLRTGRATPAILDGVKIESYGSKLPINQVANVGIEDARTIRITPWDKNQISAIEKAITDSNLGLSVSSSDAGVRVSFPELTEERRKTLVKVLKDKLEEARISLRGSRDEIWEDIQKKEKDGEITEDDKFRLKDKMQELIDKTQKNLEEKAKKKEGEIMA